MIGFKVFDDKRSIQVEVLYASLFFKKFTKLLSSPNLNFPPEVESRIQRSRPRPRAQKKSEAKDRLFEDRPSRGQRQEMFKAKDQGHNFFNYDWQIFYYFLAQKYLR